MQLPKGKKIYFASDFHLGIPNLAESKARERKICTWLDSIAADAAIIYLVGDIFDTWFEYKNVVPRGFVRLLGKLAQMTDSGLRIEAFTGNHDLWMDNYFETELQIPVHKKEIKITVNNTTLLIAHGDGLGPGDNGYKLLKAVMSNPLSQWLYRRIHPDTGVAFASYLSRLGPKHADSPEKPFLGKDKEWLVQYCLQTLQTEKIDYFIFGHRHLALEYPLEDTGSMYINLGDWIKYDTYAEFDGEKATLKYYKQ
ncbi:MAG: UDP-2,3-diacylglucosamine diphosphatase [Chitinophagia bacterium]|nr:UDP-2,3-diacylglucosamine diphosphatase [Chitinophagia bacterium]